MFNDGTFLWEPNDNIIKLLLVSGYFVSLYVLTLFKTLDPNINCIVQHFIFISFQILFSFQHGYAADNRDNGWDWHSWDPPGPGD